MVRVSIAQTESDFDAAFIWAINDIGGGEPSKRTKGMA